MRATAESIFWAISVASQHLAGLRIGASLRRLQADVAAPALLGVPHLAEVPQQEPPPARPQLAQLDDLGQIPAGVLSLRRVFHLLDEELVLDPVGLRVEEDAVAGQAIAAGPARFLVVALDGLGQVVVDDEADVGFVDSHAKGDGRDDHGDLVPDKPLLGRPADRVVETSVIGKGLDAVSR